jgi:hypothetical protein
MSKKIKMKRNIQVSGGETYLGDHEYVLPPSVADPLLHDGHAVLVAEVVDDVKPEAKPTAKPEKAEQPAKEKEEKPEKESKEEARQRKIASRFQK